MGYINAGYSLSQMVSSVIFGYWCDRRRGIEPLVLSCVLLALGSGLYAYAQPFGADGIWVVFGARLMLGLSAGNVLFFSSLNNFSSILYQDSFIHIFSEIMILLQLNFHLVAGFHEAGYLLYENLL